MMVLWRRSLYWSSSSVAVLAALVVLVIFERRASPYPLPLGGVCSFRVRDFRSSGSKAASIVDAVQSIEASKGGQYGQIVL